MDTFPDQNKSRETRSTIEALEKEWDLESGFLGGLRSRVYKPDELERLISVLQSVQVDPSSPVIERRLVSLVWYIPIFLVWQKERFVEKGEDVTQLDSALNRIEALLEKILGIP